MESSVRCNDEINIKHDEYLAKNGKLCQTRKKENRKARKKGRGRVTLGTAEVRQKDVRSEKVERD